MDLKNELESAELKTRSEQLDNREKLISEKEIILGNTVVETERNWFEGQSKLKVLDKQIESQQQLLDNIATKLSTANAEYEREITRLQRVIADKIAESKIIGRDIDRLNDTLGKLQSDIKSKKSEIATIHKETIEVKRYAREQSTLAENTISEWAGRLTEFQHEVDIIQNEKNKVSADVIRLEQGKLKLANDIKDLETKLTQLSNSYDDKVQTYRNSLRALDDEVTEKQKLVVGVTNKSKQASVGLLAREKSVDIREAATRVREQEISQKERRLKANYGMAGLGYEE